MTATTPLAASIWQLATLNNAPVNLGADAPSLNFDAQTGTVRGKSGPLLFKAQYEATAGALSIVHLATNRQNEDIDSFETDFLQALSQATSWRISNGVLFLMNQANTVLATFAASAQK